MTPDLVERVARAIYCASEDIDPGKSSAHIDYWFSSPDPGDEFLRNEYSKLARAAISAMPPQQEAPCAAAEGGLLTRKPVAGEPDVERNAAQEFVAGFPVAAYRETHPEHGDRFGHRYSEHWSTPTRHESVKVERLFTEDQLRAALASQSDASPPLVGVEGLRELSEKARAARQRAELGWHVGDPHLFDWLIDAEVNPASVAFLKACVNHVREALSRVSGDAR